MDEIDLACLREQEDRDRAIAQVRARRASVSYPVCVECGEDIPVERRAAVQGVKHCIDCQERNEALRRVMAHD